MATQNRTTAGRWSLVNCIVLLLLLVLLSSCTTATTATSGLLISDETGKLDKAQIEQAAAPLIARGAQVGLIVVAQSDGPEADMQRRLAEAGLLTGSEINENALSLYISIDPHYSELRAGRQWSPLLPNATLREIRLATLNPALRSDEFTAGVAATLRALEERLGNPSLWTRISRSTGYIVIGIFLLFFIGISPLGEWFSNRWQKSLPGRALQWLWDQTPAGRARLKRILATTQHRLDNRVQYARSWDKEVKANQDLQTRLKTLDSERVQAQQMPMGRTLISELDRLAYAYESVGREAERRRPPDPPKKKKKSRRSTGTYASSAVADTSYTPSSSSSDSSSDWSSSSSSDWSSSSSSDSSGPSSDGGPW